MTSDIYYFTGTGNSLDIARKLAEQLGGCELHSIPQAMQRGKISTDCLLGIVCPIHMYNLPLMVAEFIRKIKSSPYIFIIFTCGGEVGSTMKRTQELFREQHLRLSAAFTITMPSNYTPFGATPEAVQARQFTNAEKRVIEIAHSIKTRQRTIEKSTTGFFKTYIHPGILYRLGYKYMNTLDRSFFTDANCNGCGICQEVCPVDNIIMTEEKPQWQGKCHQCFACLQWCPNQSIQSGKKTATIPRYHHPNVTVKDIIQSNHHEKKSPDLQR